MSKTDEIIAAAKARGMKQPEPERQSPEALRESLLRKPVAVINGSEIAPMQSPAPNWYGSDPITLLSTACNYLEVTGKLAAGPEELIRWWAWWKQNNP
jgi:hypothetical protein